MKDLYITLTLALWLFAAIFGMFIVTGKAEDIVSAWILTAFFGILGLAYSAKAGV